MQEFEVKREHIKLIKNLKWDESGSYYPRVSRYPFGSKDDIKDAAEILGYKVVVKDGIVMKTSTEEKVKQLINELTTALEISLYFLQFRTGIFRRADENSVWERVVQKKPKKDLVE